MADRFTVIVSEPEVDGVVAGALVGRAAEGQAEALVFDSQGLLEFFGPGVQEKLPRNYDLVLCGPAVVHSDWDGRLVRPRLMDALRGFLGPVRWYSARSWEPEDRRAVGHIVGDGNLMVSETAASVAAMVCDACFGAGHQYEDSLVRFAEGRLSKEEEEDWGAQLRLVLTVLKADHYDLAGAVGALMGGRPDVLIGKHGDRARRTDEQNRAFARENAGEPRVMGRMKLVFLSLPPDKQPFWAEVSAYARQAAEAGLSLCHLEGRSVMLLACDADLRVDLRVWMRYVTDLVPAARSVGARPDVVPLVVRGLADDLGLREEVLSLMADGAHLLRA